MSRRTAVTAQLSALCALLGAAASAHAGQELQLVAAPASLVLGTDSGCDLTLSGPAGLSEPRLSANLGTIEQLAPAGPGRWTARYRPPAKRHPQVAIISALAGSAQAFVSVPLFGQGEAVIKTRPRARIEAVRIGERTFGPATADELGVAKVPVVVPPGVTTAFNGTQAIDLGLPQTLHLHAALDRDAADADQATTLKGFVYLVTKEGKPRAETALGLGLKASRGEAKVGPAVAPGVLPLTWTLPAGPRETAQLTVWLKSEPEQVQTLAVQRGSGTATGLSLQPERAQILAGETELLVRVLAVDALGNPASPRFTLQPSLGSAPALREVEPGRFETRVSLPPSFGAATALELKAVSESGQILASASLPLVPGEALLSLEPKAATVDADGRGHVALKVKAQDRFGNPVGLPEAKALLGGARLRAVSPGEYAVDYAAPKRDEPTEDTVTISLGALVEKGSVSLVPRTAGFEAAAKLGFIGNGGMGGAFLAGEGGYHFTVHGQSLVVLAELSWYRFSSDETLANGDTLAGQHDFLAPLVSLGWRRTFGQNGHWIFNLDLGLGFSEVWTRLQAGTQPAQSETGLAFAYQGTVGIERVLWRGGAFLELRYCRLGQLGTTNLRGQLGTILLDIGYRYDAF